MDKERRIEKQRHWIRNFQKLDQNELKNVYLYFIAYTKVFDKVWHKVPNFGYMHSDEKNISTELITFDKTSWMMPPVT